MWGRALTYFMEPEKIIQIFKRVCFRHTRNYSLWWKLSAEKPDIKDLILLPTRSKKIWQCDLLSDHVHWLTEGYRLFQVGDWPNKKTRFFRDRIDAVKEPHLAYELVFASTVKPRWDQAMLRLIYDRATDEKNWDIIRFLDLGMGTTIDERMALMERLLCLYDADEMNLYDNPLPVQVNYIPNLPNYVYDCQTKIGRKRLLENWKKVKPNKVIPETAKIDLRWSNQAIGLDWRFRANKYCLDNSVNIVDIPWDDIIVPVEAWEKIIKLDHYFHPEFYKSLDLQRNANET